MQKKPLSMRAVRDNPDLVRNVLRQGGATSLLSASKAIREAEPCATQYEKWEARGCPSAPTPEEQRCLAAIGGSSSALCLGAYSGSRVVQGWNATFAQMAGKTLASHACALFKREPSRGAFHAGRCASIEAAITLSNVTLSLVREWRGEASDGRVELALWHAKKRFDASPGLAEALALLERALTAPLIEWTGVPWEGSSPPPLSVPRNAPLLRITHTQIEELGDAEDVSETHMLRASR